MQQDIPVRTDPRRENEHKEQKSTKRHLRESATGVTRNQPRSSRTDNIPPHGTKDPVIHAPQVDLDTGANPSAPPPLREDPVAINMGGELPVTKGLLRDFPDVVTGDQLNPEEADLLNEFMLEHALIFEEDDMSPAKIPPMRIFRRDPTLPPVRARTHRLLQPMRECAQEHIDELLRQDKIYRTTSQYSAGILLVKKPGWTPENNQRRLVINYKELNEHIEDDADYLTTPLECLDNLQGQKYFTTLDMKSGYHQIPLHPEDQHLTAFAVPGVGHFAWKRVPMGIKTASRYFVRSIEEVLSGLIHVCCMLYVDDIIVFGRTFAELLVNMEKVFMKLKNANIHLGLLKCIFMSLIVKYLGSNVFEGGHTMTQERVSALMKFSPPANRRAMKRFLGMVRYYARYLPPKYVEVIAPLQAMTSKAIAYQWGTPQEDAFYTIKKMFLKLVQILHFPDFKLPFIVQSDASDVGCGAVLYQVCDGHFQPITHFAHQFSTTEARYPTIEKECYGIISSVRAFRPYLFGKRFELQTDHKNLKWMARSTNDKVLRWACELCTYNMFITYIPGPQNIVADALSRSFSNADMENMADRRRAILNNPVQHFMEEKRLEVLQEEIANEPTPTRRRSPRIKARMEATTNNQGRKYRSIPSATLPQVQSPIAEITASSTAVQANASAALDVQASTSASMPSHYTYEARNTATLMEATSVHTSPTIDVMSLPYEQRLKQATSLTSDEELRSWTAAHNMTLRQGLWRRTTTIRSKVVEQIMLPEHEDLKPFKKHLIAIHHHHPSMGHSGPERTGDRLHQWIHWKGIRADVIHWVHACLQCLRVNATSFRNEEMRITEALHPNQTVQLDHVGPFPTRTLKGNICVLTIHDRFTRFTVLAPVPSTSALATANALHDRWISLMGVPESIVTDQGSAFTSAVFKIVCQRLGINHRLCAVRHPEAVGGVEKANGLWCKALKKCITDANYTQWDDLLPAIQFARNNTTCETTGASPNELVFGRVLRQAPQIMYTGDENKSSTEISRPESDTFYTHSQYLEDLRAILRDAHDIARKTQRKATQAYANRFNRTVKRHRYIIGEHVLYWTRDAQDKLCTAWSGPWIIRSVENTRFTLQYLTDQERIIHGITPKLMFPIPDELLEAADIFDDASKGANPDTVLPEGLFLVESVSNLRRIRRVLLVDVKWEGYEAPTVEPLRQVIKTDACRKFLHDYHKDLYIKLCKDC